MLIQIRIIIDVPLQDQKRYPEAIENIVAEVVHQFPGLKMSKEHSPVTVTIKDFGQEIKSK